MSESDSNELKMSLEQIRQIIVEIREAIKILTVQSTAHEIWKAEAGQKFHHGHQEFQRLREEMAQKVDKRTVLAYLAGAVAGTAGLVKILGG